MESCRYQTGAKYYCSLDCIALFFRWILVYSVFCLSSIALVLMYCDSYFWKSWSWSWHYYQGKVNSLLLTASQNHSFTLLHNYLVINLIEVKKKKKIHLIKRMTTRFFIYQNGRCRVFEAANCIKNFTSIVWKLPIITLLLWDQTYNLENGWKYLLKFNLFNYTFPST